MKIVNIMNIKNTYDGKLLNLYNEILIELKKPVVAKPEAAPNDVYGQYFNANNRKDIKVNEPNTGPEQTLVNALDMYFNNNIKGSLEKQLPTVDSLLKKGKYSKILKAPQNMPVYRLMFNLTPETAASILRLPVESIKEDFSQAWYVSGGGTLPTTKTKIQGWTEELNPKLLKNISGFSTPSGTGVALLVASNTNNGKFFLNPEETPKAGIRAMPEEKETISYGPVEFNEAAYFYIVPNKSPALYPEMLAKTLVVALNTKHVKQFGYEKQVQQSFAAIEREKNKYADWAKFIEPFFDQVQKFSQALGPENIKIINYLIPEKSANLTDFNIEKNKVIKSFQNYEVDEHSYIEFVIRTNNNYAIRIRTSPYTFSTGKKIILKIIDPLYNQQSIPTNNITDPKIITNVKNEIL